MNINRPVLSVIVPIYGVEEYLPQCIESIIEQKYKNLDIILVDDGSKGCEPVICDKYAKKDSRITVIHKKNEGLVAARKTGINNAKGEYITFVDGDDYLSSDFYEKMMEWVIDESPDLVAVSFTQLFSNGKKEIIYQSMENGIYSEKIEYLWRNLNCKEKKYYDFGIFPSTCLKIYRKDLLLKTCFEIPSNIKLGEDAALSFPYILNCKKIVIDNSISGYYYRVVGNSMSRVVNKNIFVESNALINYLKRYYKLKDDGEIETQLELYRAYLVKSSLEKMFLSSSMLSINKYLDVIKQAKKQTNIFDRFENSTIGCIPEDLIVYLAYISNDNWLKFKIVWIIKMYSRKLYIIINNFRK